MNLTGYQFSKITIAGSGATQTDLYLTALNSGSLANLTGGEGFGNFKPSATDPLHGDYTAGNWRQAVPQFSMQIVADSNGNIQIDIDPNNPDSRRRFGHWWDVIRNTVTGRDTDYNSVATALQKRGVNVFNCP